MSYAWRIIICYLLMHKQYCSYIQIMAYTYMYIFWMCFFLYKYLYENCLKLLFFHEFRSSLYLNETSVILKNRYFYSLNTLFHSFRRITWLHKPRTALQPRMFALNKRPNLVGIWEVCMRSTRIQESIITRPNPGINGCHHHEYILNTNERHFTDYFAFIINLTS